MSSVLNIFREKIMHVLVMGAGRSGLSAAQLLLRDNHHVTLFDDQPLAKLRYLRESDLQENDKLRFALQTPYALSSNINCVVVSPGFSLNHPLIIAAKQSRIPLLSEIDLGMAYVNKAKLIGITGTNGKSTTTVMVEAILKAAGAKVIACGNLGRPFTEVVGEFDVDIDYLVLELSSFQLESSSTLRLDGAIIVNITPDHLDRHANFQEYLDAKLKIVDFLNAQAPFIVHDSLQGIGHRLAHAQYFSGYQLAEDNFSFIKNLPIRGVHNQENALAAMLLARGLGLTNQVIETGLAQFKALPHRCEIVLQKQGLLFVNDSKGTTVEAVKKALNSFPQPTHLLLGGVAKGEDFAVLSHSAFPQVKAYYVYGRDQDKILADLKSDRAEAHHDLAHAMRAAIQKAQHGDAIVLSPGCASYDQFEDYHHRGETFKTLASRIMDDLCT